MKKLLFTALAVVAFSGAAIAKTEEIKTKDLQFVEDPCGSICHLAYDLARREGASHASADAYADGCYASCLESQAKLKELSQN